MNKTAYIVLAILEAKPGKEEELKQLLISVIPPSRSEETCLEYYLHQDINNPFQFFLYEKWANKEAHEAQFSKPYIIALAEKIGDLLAKPYNVIFGEELVSPPNFMADKKVNSV